ncbi:galactokinase [Taxawa tesnikishii (nom. ined.)]|nr:galactokinase [Dothideales sp. JES 119]
MKADVPVTSSLEDIYPQDALDIQKKRWSNLLSAFKSRYGKPAEYVSRSPGRVNLIGEHIDYSLYEVIPMAVTADVLIAVAVARDSSSSTVRIANVNEDKFPTRNFDIGADGDVDIDAGSHEWTNYFKSGLRGATELLKRREGRSGIAAFVCASALATMKAYGADSVDKKELVELAIVSERAVGVNSGGMDQSASVFSLRGSALYVSFLPELDARAISFPQTHTPLTFVIAQSYVAADKHVTAPVCYNLRVVECTLAALVLAKICNLKRPLPQDSSPLGDRIPDNNKTDIATYTTQLEQLVKLVEDYLPQEEGYTREQISEISGTPISELEQKFMTKFPVRAEHFKLRQRALHVFSEALRVLRFVKLLESEKPRSEQDSEALLRELGGLLNDTQDSCRDVYECSCPELDELCQLARSAGAYGSRLTGAGWGGCCVHLVPQDKVDKVKKTWEDKYYRKRFPDMSDEKLREAVVVSKPGSGSTMFLVEGREGL